MTGHAASRPPEVRLAWCPSASGYKPATTKGPGFIRGPLPLPWMQCAARMPGKTLQVALVLWYLAGLQKSRTVRLATKSLALMGVSRDAKYDGLARLEREGLVSIEQKPGHAPVVTLLDRGE